MERLIKKAAFESLLQAFKEDIIPMMREIEFQPSVFATHHFGKDGRDYVFTFTSLQNSRTLDLIHFRISYDELSIRVFYNRIQLNRSMEDLSYFRGKDGLSLLLMPFIKTEMEIKRLAPIPFLKIPKMYRLKKTSNTEKVEKSVSSTITNLKNDLKNFDIIRSEWDSHFKPIEISVEDLT